MTLQITVVSSTSSPQASYGQPAQLAQKGGQGWLRVRTATLTGDTAYPSGATGGYPVTASTFLFSTQLVGLLSVATSGTQVPYPEFDYGSSVIRFYQASGATSASECASGTNLSAVTWRIVVMGF